VTSAVYVYGVMPAGGGGPIPVAGVQGVTVRTVELDGLAALTSDLRDGALAAAREVRAHWSVLDEAAKTGTVLPTRFGTVLESAEAVRTHLLEPNAERLHELLAAMAGRVQLNLKGDYDEERLLPELVKQSPAISGLRDKLRELRGDAGYYERIRLGELVAGEVARRREADTQQALDLLAPLAVDTRTEPPAQLYSAYKLAFLVERDRQDDFTLAVDRLAAQHADCVAIRYVGPLPPYSFAEADLTPRSEAWA
jgi:hypothetical protein